MKERLRDKSRDDLTHALNSLGVGAEMAERGRSEENIQKPRGKRSLGVIDLPKGPISCINFVRQDGSQYSPPRWWIVLCIPDERPFSKRRTVKIKTVKKIGNLEIRRYVAEFRGWTLQVDKRFAPTAQDWTTIRKIADYLLASR